MNILSLFTHPHVFSKFVCCYFFSGEQFFVFVKNLKINVLLQTAQKNNKKLGMHSISLPYWFLPDIREILYFLGFIFDQFRPVLF